MIDLTKVKSADLFDALERRLLRFEREAQRLGNVGPARALVSEAFDAGRLAGRVELLQQLGLRLSHVLDEATAQTPEPVGADADDRVREAYWRDGRRVLWQCVESERQSLEAEAAAMNAEASKRRQWVERRAGEVLAPPVPLRLRLGQWLLAQSARMVEAEAQRGAS